MSHAPRPRFPAAARAGAAVPGAAAARGGASRGRHESFPGPPLGSEAGAVKELLRRIVLALVDDADAVSVQEVVGGQAHVLEVHVAPSDVAKVIGRKGAHAIAIRTLLSACSGKARRRYILEIIEDLPLAVHLRSRTPDGKP